MNGVTVATAPSDNTVTGVNGVPITLVGGAETKITYYATIDQSGGRAVTLSQQLIEDSFQGSVFQKAELLAEKPLVSAPDDVDPDDPNAPVAGSDYHYARKPAPNENGWNNTSPVSVEFFGGDFDSLNITDVAGSLVGVLGDREVWKRTEDTNGYAVVYQADNSKTGALSSAQNDTIRIDTWKPTLSYNDVLDTLVASDEPPAGGNKATSGIWKIQRVNNSRGAAAAASGGDDGSFDLVDGVGEARRTLSAPANGYYVAVDAAGNQSLPVQVGSTPPPSVDRPLESTGDPDDPSKPVNPPVGPPIGPDDKVPDPVVKPDPDGLLHAVIEETVTEIIDPVSPSFGGTLDAAKAKAMMDYRYAASSAAGVASVSDELLDAAGNPLTSLDTTSPGECLVRRVITDNQGNTTTINLHYRCVRDSCPVVRPWEPVDPTDPTGPKEPGEPLPPTGPVTTGPDGAQRVEVTAEVTEAVSRGAMDASGAEALLRRHFDLAAVDGSPSTLTVQFMEDAAGNRIAAIDLSRVADYKITYLVRDAAGNTTTVRLVYHLISSHVSGVVVTPDPGTDPNPQPGDDPLNPRPRPIDPAYPPEVAPDGTQHAVIEDEMRVKVQDGLTLSLADVRSLVQRRYSFTPEGGGSVTERALSLAGANGVPVASIDRSRPGAWRITYQVADANGHTITVHLRYLVVSAPPSVTPVDPPMVDPSAPTIIPDPNHSAADKPLEPVSVTVDPKTGLVHAVVEDSVTIPTSSEAVTPDQMAAFIRSYYKALTTWGNGTVTAGEVRLFDASGNPVGAIDRTVPGSWTAEQVFTDGAGNTTLMRLHVKVVRGSAEGSMESGDHGSGAADGDGSGVGAGDSKGTRFGTAITQLPRTGGLLGPCPLHILFVLMTLVVSSYSLMRLRRSAARSDRARPRPALAAEGAQGEETDENETPFRYTVLDAIAHGVIFCCTVCLGLLRFCPYDLLFAVAVVLIEGLWVALMVRRARRDARACEAG